MSGHFESSHDKQNANTMKQLKHITIAFVLFFLADVALGQGIIFYLHGRIVEVQGIHAVDTANGYGAYEYTKILNTFRKNGFKVISEVRKMNTRPVSYAQHVVHQIDSLLKEGTNPGDITVIGASKGALIAMLTSSMLKNKGVNFVFMAACNPYSFKQFPELKFYGNILSIYEESDRIGRTCSGFRARSGKTISHYKEIELHTGLKHGFLFKPLPQWVVPALKWARKDYQ